MKVWYSAREIADAKLPGMPTSERSIHMLAKREGWTDDPARCRKREGRGGGAEYHHTLFPAEARAELARRAVAPIPADGTLQPTAAEMVARARDGLTGRPLAKLDAYLEIMPAFDGYREISGQKDHPALRRFEGLYNKHEVALPDWVYANVPRLSVSTLRRRLEDRERGDLARFGGRYGNRRNDSVIERCQPLHDFIIGLITHAPHLSGSGVRRAAEARFGKRVETVDKATGAVKVKDLPSLRGFERFLVEWKDANQALFAAVTNPDRYRNQFRPAPGRLYDHLTRPNELWELDASPADAMCRDGRFSLYLMADCWPRRLIARLTRTPKATAALLTLRDAINDWGVPEVLRTDNGSDFVSFHFQDCLKRLGIAHDPCTPYSPEQRGLIERHIGLIQHGFMELLPGYIGHDVADRKAIEGRRSFAERLGCSDEKAFCVELTAAELQERLNAYLKTVWPHQSHGGLGGKTPFEVMSGYRGRISRIEGVKDKGALEILLAEPADGKGARIVGKKGIQVNGIEYLHPALNLPGEQVHVRLDPDDLGQVYVYRGDPWEFLCVAVNPERAGVSRAEMAAKVKAEHQKVLAEGKKEIRRKQRGITLKTVSDEMLRAGQRHADNLIAFPQSSQPHTTPDLEAAGEAARALAPTTAAPVSPEFAARHQAAVVKLAQPPPARESDGDRWWRRAQAIEARLAAGEPVEEIDREWLAVNRREPWYRARRTAQATVAQGAQISA